jgi:hypothetical protein
MFIYHSDGTVTIKCPDGEFRTYVLQQNEFLKYVETGEFDFENRIEVNSSAI